MAEHTHGEMDTKVQEQTFERFIKFVGWSCVLIILTLIFIALINA